MYNYVKNIIMSFKFLKINYIIVFFFSQPSLNAQKKTTAAYLFNTKPYMYVNNIM
jgi:hypothetical protein